MALTNVYFEWKNGHDRERAVMSVTDPKRTSRNPMKRGELFVPGRNRKSHRMFMRLKPGGNGYGCARKIRSASRSAHSLSNESPQYRRARNYTSRSGKIVQKEAKG
jgi:hypothetical protein